MTFTEWKELELNDLYVELLRRGFTEEFASSHCWMIGEMLDLAHHKVFNDEP